MKIIPFVVLGLIVTALRPLPAAAQSTLQTKTFAEVAIAREFRFPASVVTLQLATVASEGSGRIIDFPWLEGDRVRQGQVLLRLDCRDAELQLKRARAGLKRLRAARELTELELERARGLVTSRSISRAELDQREAQLSADKASIDEQQAVLAATEESVKDCSLKAPFDGVIIERQASLGSYTAPGQAVLKLLKTDAVEVHLEIPVDRLSALRQAQSIHYQANDQRYPLVIRRILPFINGGSLQQQVRLSFSGEQRPPGGSFGQISFTSAKTYLPAAYLQKRDGRFGVFSVVDGEARFIPLDNAAEGQSALAPLPADTVLVVSGLKQLQNGDPVATENE